MIEISKEVGIDMGHRIPDHASQCQNLHGHRYTVTAVATAPQLETQGAQKGMVMDFGFLKQALMHLHSLYDHQLVLYQGDPLAVLLGLEMPDKYRGLVAPVVLVPVIPTAENLAVFWFGIVQEQLKAMAWRDEIPSEAGLIRMVVQETPTSIAVYEP